MFCMDTQVWGPARLPPPCTPADTVIDESKTPDDGLHTYKRAKVSSGQPPAQYVAAAALNLVTSAK